MSGEKKGTLFDLDDPVVEFELRRLRGQVRTPAGTVAKFTGSTVPQGWLRADASKVQKIDYPQLAAVLGETADYFNLPRGEDYYTIAKANGGIPIATPTDKLWVDGRRIFRSVHYEAALPNNTTTTYTHSIAGILYPTSVTGIAVDTTAGIATPLGHTNFVGWLTNVAANYDTLSVTTIGDHSSYEGYFTIEYTMAEDAPAEQYIIKT